MERFQRGSRESQRRRERRRRERRVRGRRARRPRPRRGRSRGRERRRERDWTARRGVAARELGATWRYGWTRDETPRRRLDL
eukprot:30837-Pelagococcus_subviridis.AAC.25